jgi:hypothetical protein
VNADHTAVGASLALIALLVGGCATAAPSPSTAASDSRSIKRCSPGDPDRHAWFCMIGQILYGVVGAMQPDGGYSLR